MAIVLVATAGAVVDFTTIEQNRTRVQDALDSAALGLQPRIFENGITEEQLRADAELLLLERLAGQNVTAQVDSAAMNIPDGTLRLNASITVPMAFVSLVGFDQINARVVSEATRKKLSLEVVMVLDNSNSMSDHSRMTKLRTAANCAVGVLLNGACNSQAAEASVPNTKIAIVPFTMQVNVGSQYRNAWWVDREGNGASNITNDNFDDDSNDASAFNGPIDRIALFDQLGGVNWGGCMEARTSPHDTTDTTPVAGTNTMFTPLFAPDEPDGWNNSYLSDTGGTCKPAPRYVWTRVTTRCNTNVSGSGSSATRSYDRMTCSNGTTTDTYHTVSVNGVVTSASSSRPATLPTEPGTNLNPGNSAYSDSYSSTSSGSGTYRYTVTRVRTWTYEYSDRELQERLCKYQGAWASGINQAYARGPNADCPNNAILPLTASKPAVTAAVSQLSPQGGTNIHAGAIWGWRVLSPGEPFTEGSPYEEATSKVMILMTDGENTAYQFNNMNNTRFYSYYGFPWNNRMGSSNSSNTQLETEMNNRLRQTCTNAKAQGIRIYTIGLAVGLTSNPATNTQLLKDCSSGAGYWYFPTDNDNLTDVFETIASQLSTLRLAL